jgi:hypothetical protein
MKERIRLYINPSKFRQLKTADSLGKELHNIELRNVAGNIYREFMPELWETFEGEDQIEIDVYPDQEVKKEHVRFEKVGPGVSGIITVEAHNIN